MDKLPWHLQLRIYRGIGIDTLRALGVSPSRLAVPASLRASLENRMCRRQSWPLVAADGRWWASYGSTASPSWHSIVSIPIAGTAKTYELRRRSDDGCIDVLVMLHEKITGGFRHYDFIIMHRSEVPLDGYSWAQQVRLR